MKLIVTGCAGFIGQNLTKKLLDSGHEVLGIDNFETSKRENINRFINHKRFSFVEIDLSSGGADNILKGNYDAVFHVAFIPRVPYSIEHPQLTTKKNMLMMVNILELMKKNKIDKIINSSSSSVYGDVDLFPTPEDITRKPMSPYATQKLACEEYIKAYSRMYSFKYINLRYFNVYGEYQDPEGSYATLIPKTIEKCLKGEKPIIYGDGTKSRDFTYITDVVEANIKAMNYLNNLEGGGLDINTCFGKSISVMEIVKQIIKLTGYRGEIDFQKERIEPNRSYGDNTKLRNLIGYEPETEYMEGLKRTVEFFKGKE